VVYVSAAAGNDDIYLQSTSGQTAINLTKDSSADDNMPAFSPDGEFIAFRSERDHGGLFVMGRTGESVRRLTTNGYYPSWSPDGRRIVFSTEGSPFPESRFAISELWEVGVSGEEPHAIGEADAVQPRISPHGLRIAYWGLPVDSKTKQFSGTNRDIWTVDLAGKSPVRVTDHEADDWNPVWSPDGRWLYFFEQPLRQHESVADCAPHLQQSRSPVRVDSVSDDSHEVLAIEGESLSMPVLTADTSQLFFTRRTSQGDIWVVHFGDANTRPH